MRHIPAGRFTGGALTLSSPGVVLLVEDDPILLDIYTTKLLAAGFSVHSAPDLARARELFRQHAPDRACVDVRLPDGSGVDLAREFEASGTRTILLTNDQKVVDHPPEGVTAVLLKIATPPGELALALVRLVAT